MSRIECAAARRAERARARRGSAGCAPARARPASRAAGSRSVHAPSSAPRRRDPSSTAARPAAAAPDGGAGIVLHETRIGRDQQHEPEGYRPSPSPVPLLRGEGAVVPISRRGRAGRGMAWSSRRRVGRVAVSRAVVDRHSRAAARPTARRRIPRSRHERAGSRCQPAARRLGFLDPGPVALACRMTSRRCRRRLGAPGGPRGTDNEELLHVDSAAFDEFWRFDDVGLARGRRGRRRDRTRASTREAPLAGYALFGRADDVGYVQRLAVRPDAQGRGLGPALLSDGLRWLRLHSTPSTRSSTPRSTTIERSASTSEPDFGGCPSACAFSVEACDLDRSARPGRHRHLPRGRHVHDRLAGRRARGNHHDHRHHDNHHDEHHESARPGPAGVGPRGAATMDRVAGSRGVGSAPRRPRHRLGRRRRRRDHRAPIGLVAHRVRPRGERRRATRCAGAARVSALGARSEQEG